MTWKPEQLITFQRDLEVSWSNKPVTTLRMIILLVLVVIGVLIFFIDNPYVLAVILAYIVLP